MDRSEYNNRIIQVRAILRRGDKKAIAGILGVHRAWVSRVIHGHGISEIVLRAAEQLIKEREQQTN